VSNLVQIFRVVACFVHGKKATAMDSFEGEDCGTLFEDTAQPRSDREVRAAIEQFMALDAAAVRAVQKAACEAYGVDRSPPEMGVHERCADFRQEGAGGGEEHVG
jgi:hypothetical protein